MLYGNASTASQSCGQTAAEMPDRSYSKAIAFAFLVPLPLARLSVTHVFSFRKRRRIRIHHLGLAPSSTLPPSSPLRPHPTTTKELGCSSFQNFCQNTPSEAATSELTTQEKRSKAAGVTCLGRIYWLNVKDSGDRQPPLGDGSQPPTTQPNLVHAQHLRAMCACILYPSAQGCMSGESSGRLL
ncbi:unnamed protein product [Pleuronectes platessa]|uniref:Uncharacterized protein n=1 Tax=Pleuronectes platessa TaxID=8262 RepID=A0A9N7V627_PLEPL|nr:unnamed protein product [Pleuronectes platessa]